MAQHRRAVVNCRRVGDLWAFDDVESTGVLQLDGLGLELPLADIYSDAVGDIVP